jgi:hypothetical protein
MAHVKTLTTLFSTALALRPRLLTEFASGNVHSAIIRVAQTAS